MEEATCCKNEGLVCCLLDFDDLSTAQSPQNNGGGGGEKQDALSATKHFLFNLALHNYPVNLM